MQTLADISKADLVGRIVRRVEGEWRGMIVNDTARVVSVSPLGDDVELSGYHEGHDLTSLELVEDTTIDSTKECNPTEQYEASAQVGGDHYGTGTDVFAWSLEREHDCLQHAAIKYIDRHKLKNGKEDILKALSVCQRILKEHYPD